MFPKIVAHNRASVPGCVLRDVRLCVAGTTVPLLRYAPLTWQSGSQSRLSLWNIFVN